MYDYYTEYYIDRLIKERMIKQQIHHYVNKLQKYLMLQSNLTNNDRYNITKMVYDYFNDSDEEKLWKQSYYATELIDEIKTCTDVGYDGQIEVAFRLWQNFRGWENGIIYF